MINTFVVVPFHATSRLSQCIFHIGTMCCTRFVNVRPGNKRLQYCDLHLCRATGALGRVVRWKHVQICKFC